MAYLLDGQERRHSDHQTNNNYPPPHIQHKRNQLKQRKLAKAAINSELSPDAAPHALLDPQLADLDGDDEDNDSDDEPISKRTPTNRSSAATPRIIFKFSPGRPPTVVTSHNRLALSPTSSSLTSASTDNDQKPGENGDMSDFDLNQDDSEADSDALELAEERYMIREQESRRGSKRTFSFTLDGATSESENEYLHPPRQTRFRSFHHRASNEELRGRRHPSVHFGSSFGSNPVTWSGGEESEVDMDALDAMFAEDNQIEDLDPQMFFDVSDSDTARNPDFIEFSWPGNGGTDDDSDSDCASNCTACGRGDASDDGHTTDSLDDSDHSGLVRFGIEFDGETSDSDVNMDGDDLDFAFAAISALEAADLNSRIGSLRVDMAKLATNPEEVIAETARTLGVDHDTAARILTNVGISALAAQEDSQSSAGDSVTSRSALLPAIPENEELGKKVLPKMGVFPPSIASAVIDGTAAVPSPFSAQKRITDSPANDITPTKNRRQRNDSIASIQSTLSNPPSTRRKCRVRSVPNLNANELPSQGLTIPSLSIDLDQLFDPRNIKLGKASPLFKASLVDLEGSPNGLRKDRHSAGDSDFITYGLE